MSIYAYLMATGSTRPALTGTGYRPRDWGVRPGVIGSGEEQLLVEMPPPVADEARPTKIEVGPDLIKTWSRKS